MKRYYIVEISDQKYLDTNLFYAERMLRVPCSYKVSTIGKQVHKRRVILESTSEESLDIMAQAIEMISGKRKLERVE